MPVGGLPLVVSGGLWCLFGYPFWRLLRLSRPSSRPRWGIFVPPPRRHLCQSRYCSSVVAPRASPPSLFPSPPESASASDADADLDVDAVLKRPEAGAHNFVVADVTRRLLLSYKSLFILNRHPAIRLCSITFVYDPASASAASEHRPELFSS